MVHATIQLPKSITFGLCWFFGIRLTDGVEPPTTLNEYSSVNTGDLFGRSKSKFTNSPFLILSITDWGRGGIDEGGSLRLRAIVEIGITGLSATSVVKFAAVAP